MKRALISFSFVSSLLLLLTLISCHPESKDGKGHAGKPADSTKYTIECDTIYTNAQPSLDRTEYKLKDKWIKGKTYTVCALVDDPGSVVKKVKIIIKNAETKKEVITQTFKRGETPVITYTPPKTFNAVLKIVIFKVDGSDDSPVSVSTSDSACGVSQTVKESVKATSSGNCTVLVTIDEK